MTTGTEETTQVKLRRYRDALATSGLAVIAFGVWDMAKSVLWFFTSQDEYLPLYSEEERELMQNLTMRILAFILFAIIMGLILAFHVWLGKGAISEGRGRRLRRPYVTFSVLLFVFTLAGVVAGLVLAWGSDANDSFSLHTLVIDLTFLYALFELIRSARAVRRLSRKE